jgi:DNA damage-inducible protein 1
MLYIPVEVNGVNVKAFVDSGAQATIMSPSCAEQCNIMRLLDTSFAGMARGVGTAKILGRVHSAMIKIGTLHLPCSFTVMEGKDVDLLLGLDMLKRHQACIDLRKGALVVGEDEIPFLGEADIPKMPSWFGEEPTVEGPAGTQIGGRSGAVIAPSVGQSAGSRPGEVAGGSQGHGGPVSGTASTSQRLTSPQTQVPAGSGQRSGTYPPGHVNQLMELGFSREEVLRALEMAGGNLDVAAGILYQ